MVFVSYSHDDDAWHKRLQKIAKPIQRHLGIEFWSDKRIKPGDFWEREIRQAMERSKIAVLLVSDNFLASEFINNVELPFFINKRNKGLVRIVWTLISPCLWEKTPLRPLLAQCDQKLEPLC